MNLKTLQTERNAEPFGHSDGAYGGAKGSTTWDEDGIYGCVCESGWVVGYGSGETQAPEWFGADCSQRRCPSGDDPRTFARPGDTDHQWYDETNCFLRDRNGAVWRGPLDGDGAPDYTTYSSNADLQANAQAGTYFATNAAAAQWRNVGVAGNKCHVDCSNRGYCDFSSGTCLCFAGYYGLACEKASVLAQGAYRPNLVQVL